MLRGLGLRCVVMMVCLAALAGPVSALAAPRRPNVVFISIDTTRADFLTFRDAETARNMTALAQRGTIFDQAVSGTSWTLPAHAEMFTGMAPAYHGAEAEAVMVDPLTPFLPEVLAESGYHTVGVFNVRYLWADYGFGRGFDVYQSAMLVRNIEQEEVRFAPRGAAARDRMLSIESGDYVTSQNVLPLVRRAVERAPLDEPLFLFVHYFDPHNDYNPPAPWDTAFDADYEGGVDGRGYLSNKQIFDELKKPKRQIGDRDLEHIKSLYRGEIAWVDQNVGELLALLDLHDRLDDSLIVITSDHGEEFFEHAQPGHRKSLYDEVLRVPLLIVPPESMREGLVSRVDAQASLSDLMPTLLDFIGVEVPASVVGQSLRPAMYGQPFTPEPALLSLYIAKQLGTGDKDHMQTYGLRTPEYKFFRATLIEMGKPPQLIPYYFDLTSDPEERRVVQELADPRVQRAWAALEDRLDDVRQHWQTRPRSRRADRTTDLPEDFTTQELKMLGYLDIDDTSSLSLDLKPWGLGPMARVDLPGARHGNSLMIGGILLIGAGLATAFVLRARGRSAG